MLQTKFLFMDEKYGDHRVAFSRRIVALTGVLVATDRHGVFRDRFYRILSDALPSASNVINRMPIIHASKLLPDAADDNVRCDFIERLVSIVVDFDYKIYRVGYYTSRDTMEIIKNPRSKLRGIGGRKEADQKLAASCGEYVPKEIQN